MRKIRSKSEFVFNTFVTTFFLICHRFGAPNCDVYSAIFQTKCETKKKDKLLTGDSKKVDPKDVKAYGIFAKSFFLYRGVSLT